MLPATRARILARLVLSGAALGGLVALVIVGCARPVPQVPIGDLVAAAGELGKQSQADVDRKSAGCLSCHEQTDSRNGHESESVSIGCTDCHGGTASVVRPRGTNPGNPDYEKAKEAAHVLPHRRKLFATSANPVQSYTAWLKESWDYVRFVNPGDLRVARVACGTVGCHPNEVAQVEKSIMTHGAMLWGAALYNNGAFPLKIPRFGEAYSPEGVPVRLQTVPPPTPEETFKKGVLPYLDPLPRFEITQPGNILRIFERGQRRPFETGVPIADEDPGRPANRLSQRGLGTGFRVDPVFLGIQKTRLLDPLLSMLGTNDQPGDYRSSGCTACHTIYANDRWPVHSGPYAAAGHRGLTQTVDPTIPKDEPGHPIKHILTKKIPTSQCLVCHIHPGTNMVMTYGGWIWWDNEIDGEFLYPREPRPLSAKERDQILRRNPSSSALRGLWGDPEFLAKVADLNPQLQRTQFADFHGHGWIYRAVFKKDRYGNLLDREGKVVPPDAPDKWKRVVHLMDVHLEKGMHCIDCHFAQDSHGNGKLYGETRNAVEIDCRDCHGTVTSRATLKTSAAAAPEGGNDLSTLTTPFGQRRFSRRGDVLIQRSMVVEGKEWEVPETIDSITPGAKRYSEASRLAKTMRRDGATWGDVPEDQKELAHPDSRMTCFACHSSWMTTCAGCHLVLRRNEYRDYLHWDGDRTRSWTSYEFQVIRDDAFQLGIDGNVTGNRVAPVRSSTAVVVASQNADREWIYSQQQTISAEGYSGQTFNTHVPHTVGRSGEAKKCTDCHVSEAGDNNAQMAQLLLQGTNLMNFLGRYVYVAEGRGGWEAVVATEREDPQAVIGSTLHQVAYPREYRRHVERGGLLREAYRHRGPDVLPVGSDDVRSIWLRGEYLYTANGPGGLRVYDVAEIDHKGWSQRVFTAPVSPLGQRFYVKTRHATAVAAPTTLGVDPARRRLPENAEQPIHLLYAFLYVTDAEEGLILVNAATLLDGDPANNFLKKDVVFNPNGVLTGAVNLTVAGRYVYVVARRGLVVVDVDNPFDPKVVAEVGEPYIRDPRAVAVQFRYAFVTDAEGLKVVDITFPTRPRPVDAVVRLRNAQGLYVARTYAYVAAGEEGLAIVDVEKPERPRLDQLFTAGGQLTDVRDVKVGMTNASAFAYVADGRNGLRILQLWSPRENPNFQGFIVRPTPRLIATYRTAGPAVAVSKGLDRDRAVDESGNQVAVFGRWGARPFNAAEMQRMYLRDGKLWTVKNEPPGPPRQLKPAAPEEEKKEEEPARRPRRGGGG